MRYKTAMLLVIFFSFGCLTIPDRTQMTNTDIVNYQEDVNEETNDDVLETSGDLMPELPSLSDFATEDDYYNKEAGDNFNTTDDDDDCKEHCNIQEEALEEPAESEDVAEYPDAQTNAQEATEINEDALNVSDTSDAFYIEEANEEIFVQLCMLLPNACDDLNQCTDDTCDSILGCQHFLKEGCCRADIECDDVDFCTTDTCETATGKCQHSQFNCDDGNACTTDSCEPSAGCQFTTIVCDDGNACTTDTCAPAIGCKHAAVNCDDSDTCTDDSCEPDVGCKHTLINCDDGSICTTDFCQNGVGCVHNWTCQCQYDADCDDNNPCTDNTCPLGTCVYTNNTLSCNDGDICTLNDFCDKGKCVGGVDVNCDDGNACTSDICVPAAGCQHAAVNCDDGNLCTDDTCNLATGCMYTNNTAECDDGSVCTLIDTCQGGKCVGANPLDCDDADQCSLDVCHKMLGCLHSKLSGTQYPCDNNDACTVNDYCDKGVCQAGTQTCECYATADCAVKEDGNLCNGTLKCDINQMPHKCVLDMTTIITCDTSRDTACSKNTCQPISGKCEMEAVNEGATCQSGQCIALATCQLGQCVVVNKPDGAECDDGDICTLNDFCDKGKCVGGVDVNCDDGNACTTDTCAPAIGCQHAAVNCDDGNACTDDTCNLETGCMYINNIAECDDGSVCTLIDTCKGGKCVGAAPLDCDDTNQCTLDICNKMLGCLHSKIAMNNKPCDNGDDCTKDDTCQNGACQAGTQTCDCYATPDCADKEDGDFCNGTLVCNTSVMPHKCELDLTSVIICQTTQDTACLKNTCQSISGKCEMKAVNEGGTCQSGQCIASSTCQLGQCVVVNKPDGAECDDGKSCNNNDSCKQGKCAGSSFLIANFDTGVLDAGWELTGDTPYQISGDQWYPWQGYTSPPNSLVFHDSGVDSSAFLTSPTFTLLTGHTSSLIFDYHTGGVGPQQQSFAVEIHEKSGSTTLLEKGKSPPLPWTNYILSLDNYTGEVWLTFHFVGPFIFEAIDSISVGCP